MIALGIDTSNYTTSAAWYDGNTGINVGKLLDVEAGTRGLRQSEALFQHVKRFPEILTSLVSDLKDAKFCAIGASTKPRSVAGSYMPCFLAGESQAKTLARVLHVPFYEFSHQQGHLAAALWSARRMDLMEKPMLAWHLSGGTTELLYVHPGLAAKKIGGTTDLSAGQLVDRTGLLLGYSFPAGKSLDEISNGIVVNPFPIKVQNMSFSLSGMENKVQQLYADGMSAEETAAFALGCIAEAVKQATKQAVAKYGELPVLLTGGVSSNTTLRNTMEPLGGIFGTPQCSTDNAMGIAVLTYLAEKQHG